MEYYSDLAQFGVGPLAVENRAPGWRFSGQLCFATPIWTMGAAVDDDEEVGLIKLPKGATVFPILGRVTPDADPGTLVVTIGDDDATPDSDRYSGALTVVHTAATAFVFNLAGFSPLHTLEQDSWIIAHVAAGVAATEGVGVQFVIPWLVG